MLLLLPKSSVLIFLYSTVEDLDVAVQVCSQDKDSTASNHVQKTTVLPDSAMPSRHAKTADLLDPAIQKC
jgi:hypothetical protein